MRAVVSTQWFVEMPHSAIRVISRSPSQVHASPAGAAAALRGRAERPDYSTMLRRCTVPTLVIAGDQDGYAPEPVVEQLVTALDRPEVLRLKGVGHLPNLEAPDAFNAAISAFDDRTRAGR